MLGKKKGKRRTSMMDIEPRPQWMAHTHVNPQV